MARSGGKLHAGRDHQGRNAAFRQALQRAVIEYGHAETIFGEQSGKFGNVISGRLVDAQCRRIRKCAVYGLRTARERRSQKEQGGRAEEEAAGGGPQATTPPNVLNHAASLRSSK